MVRWEDLDPDTQPGSPEARQAPRVTNVDAELRARGAVLLRGLPIATAAELSAFLRALDYPTMNTHGVR